MFERVFVIQVSFTCMSMEEVDDKLVVRFLFFLLAYVGIFFCYFGDSSIWKKRAFSHDLLAAPIANR